jgi:hypothetical protein
MLLLFPICSLAQLSESNDPSLFHFGSSTQFLQGEFQGKIDYTESCNIGSKVTSIKYKEYIYVAWTGSLGSVNIACLGSTHQKEIAQSDKQSDRNVYHGYEDTLGGFAYARYSPTMAVYRDKLYIFYNDSHNSRIRYLTITNEGTVDVAERGEVPDSPDDLVDLSAQYLPGTSGIVNSDGILFVGRDAHDNHIRICILGQYDRFTHQLFPTWRINSSKNLFETCVGTVGICEANYDNYLIAWTGTDPGHQLNSAFMRKADFSAWDRHTYNDHSSHIDGPVLFRKDNPDDKDVHILWRGANEDRKIWQGVINLTNKNDFKQFSLPTDIATANLSPTLISLNELVTYMIWPAADGSGPFYINYNIMMAKALDYSYQNWMGALIKDEHTLKNLVLPGSNNAGMNDVSQITQFPSVYATLGIPSFGDCNECGFVTQTTDVKGQLEMGYRYFGINLTNAKYSIADLGKSPYFQDHNLLHSSVQPVDHITSVCLGEGFDIILQGASDFLKAHPKEIVIINIKDLNPAVFSLSSIIDDLSATLPKFRNVLYQQEKNEKTFADLINKPIGKFRGKIILTATDTEIADALNLIQDVFNVSHDNQYRYVNTTNTRTGPLIDNQKNFFKNPAYTGSYKRIDWQTNLTWNKVLCDLKPWKSCTENPQPGFWHHAWHIVKCGADIAKMGYKVFKAFAAPEDPRNIATIVGWVMSAFGESSLAYVEDTNAHLYPTVHDMQRDGLIRKDNMVNIIYTDASDYLYTDLCMQLLTDFNEYDEVSVYNGQMHVTNQHFGVSCNAPNSGVASVKVSGGYPPYKYYWLSTGDTTTTATNLSEGVHKVRITDAMGHTVTRNVYVAMDPQAHGGLANRSMSKTEVQPYGLSNHYEADCDNLIARVESDYTTTAVNDTLTASVWIDKIQNDHYVKRHYQLIPSRNANGASAKLTLYFTQNEFDEFNKGQSTFKLPQHSNDSTGIRNVMIWQKSGLSNDNSGVLTSYESTVREIVPKTSDIVWNATASRWEITFYTEDFGAYFLTTYNSQQKNEWLTASASLNKGKPLIHWHVAEHDVKRYYVEFSFDREKFFTAGALISKGMGSNTYEFSHQNLPKLIDSSGHSVVFYRIRQLSNTGEFTFSDIMPLDYAKERTLFLYPNPVSDELTIQSSAETEVFVYDISGKLTNTVSVQRGKNTMSTQFWKPGQYIIRTSEGEFHKVIKGQ